MNSREMQLRILTDLDKIYPNTKRLNEFSYYSNELLRNIHYLCEHGLINISEAHQGDCSPCKITATGIDFLRDDGGLSAILGIKVIKIHDDTIKQIIEKKIIESNLPDVKKSALKNALKNAPVKIIEEIIKQCVSKAFTGAPEVFSMLNGFF